MEDAILKHSQTMGLTPDKLDELAQDESNRVYKYVYDEVPRQPPAQVRNKLRAIRGLVNRHPTWTWCDIKTELRANYPALFDMAHTHPKFFDLFSHPDATPKELSNALFLIDMRERFDAGMFTEKEVKHEVSAHGLASYMMDPGKTKDDVTAWNSSSRPEKPRPGRHPKPEVVEQCAADDPIACECHPK